ncbi:hypothetical protein GP475_01240 [Corynebacterium poyangense]|uniref:Cytochrome P450 n=2 Tax=Corynebacterium poyangense TaxID=2684405 RepID=A0A7H0SLH9_9CORY|nr:hypothetical protein [Corynebacterium poyangense]QNQ89404.1 hypothetical protein GP475_01240 [Corynebacterium poyangense]
MTSSAQRPHGQPDPSLPRTFLGDESYHACPYHLFQKLQDAGAVHPVDFPAVHAWLITNYDVARGIMRDPRISKDHRYASEYFLHHASIMPEPQHSELQVHLLHVDDERHDVMRPLVAEPLSARR